MLPFVEIVLGVLLVLGLFTRPAAIVSTLLMVAFIIGISQAWARGLTIDCGCFGGGGQIGADDEVPAGDRPRRLLRPRRRLAVVATALPGLPRPHVVRITHKEYDPHGEERLQQRLEERRQRPAGAQPDDRGSGTSGRCRCAATPSASSPASSSPLAHPAPARRPRLPVGRRHRHLRVGGALRHHRRAALPPHHDAPAVLRRGRRPRGGPSPSTRAASASGGPSRWAHSAPTSAAARTASGSVTSSTRQRRVSRSPRRWGASATGSTTRSTARRPTCAWRLRIYEWDTGAGRALVDAAGNPVVKGYFHPTFLDEVLWCLGVLAVALVCGRAPPPARPRPPLRAVRDGVHRSGRVSGSRLIAHSTRPNHILGAAGQRVGVGIVVFLGGLCGYLVSARRHPGREVGVYRDGGIGAGSAESAPVTAVASRDAEAAVWRGRRDRRPSALGPARDQGGPGGLPGRMRCRVSRRVDVSATVRTSPRGPAASREAVGPQRGTSPGPRILPRRRRPSSGRSSPSGGLTACAPPHVLSGPDPFPRCAACSRPTGASLCSRHPAVSMTAPKSTMPAVAFAVVTMRGEAGYGIVDLALTALRNLEHRGAAGAEPVAGDGAGITHPGPGRLPREPLLPFDAAAGRARTPWGRRSCPSDARASSRDPPGGGNRGGRGPDRPRLA